MTASLLVKCAYRDCLFRKRIMRAVEYDDDLPQLCTYQVQFTCTTCGDPKICGECYERMETRLVSDLQSTMSDREVRKALWTTNYNMTKKHPLCTCTCGGLLKAVLDGRQVMCVDVPADNALEKKKKKKKSKDLRDWNKLRVYTGDGVDGELDADQQQFIYQRTEAKSDAEVEAVEQTLDAFTLQSFPEMEKSPSKLLPPGLMIGGMGPHRSQEVRKYQPFDMIIRNHGTFHTLIVPSRQQMLWMARIIGKKGNGIRSIIAKFAIDGIRITKIYIDDVPSDSTIKRIVIAGPACDDREVCAIRLYEDINGILRKNARHGVEQ